MSWYYALNNEQKGPVEQAALELLLQQGVLTETTLVWREGMANWLPYREAFSAAPAAAPPVAPPVYADAGGVVCSECGRLFPHDQVIRVAGRSVCANCKPIAMQRLSEGVATEGLADTIRREHIKHEASIKSIGVLYFMGAVFVILMAGVMIAGSLGSMASQSGQGGAALMSAALGIVFLVIAGLQIWAGIGVRRLQPWSRIVAGVLSGIGLLGFPLGTAINAYILYLLFSKKGTTIFSDGYKEVIRQTPDIKYRTSIIVWVALGVLLFIFALGLMAYFFSPKNH
jgi:hypothetical protein